MLKARVIPTLLYKDFGLVKGVGFDSRRAVGSPMQALKVYKMRGVDELVLLDVAATKNGAGPDLHLVDDLADECFMPLTVGGGVRSVEDVGELLQIGADKVCLGTAALDDPQLVERSAARFGSQCIVVAIDARREVDGIHRVYSHSGSCPTTHTAQDFAVRMEAMGAGELLVQSIDRDGTMAGLDIELVTHVATASSLPVIASGGAGTYAHMLEGLQINGVGAVAAASMYHFTEQTPAEAKAYLEGHDVPVRR